MSFLNRLFRAPDPPYQPPEARHWSISDPAVVALFGGQPSLTGVNVSEQAALGLSAVYRAVNLIAGGIATLSLRAIREQNGVTERVPSWLDSPAGGLTRYELVETMLLHLLLHGNAYLAHVYGGAGQLVGLSPIHPSAVGIDVSDAGVKTYQVSLSNGSRRDFNDNTMTHVKGPSVDGIRGLSPLQVHRNGALGIGIAADRSAARLFKSGGLMSAIAVLGDDVGAEDAAELKASLDRKIGGEANAGEIAFINRNVTITPWQMSPEDLQWIESRSFQTEEIARIYGVPATLIGLSDKQSSWGTGIREMHTAMAQWTFKPWTARIEDRLTPLLDPVQTGRKVEFDYRALLSPSPEVEIDLLIKQVGAGLLTVDEARQIMNRAPLPQAPEAPQTDEQGTGQ
ncbi:MAG: phage portal protein [Leucobacter sp.]